MKSAPLRLAQWFEYGDHELLKDAAERLAELHVTELRTFISWADWARPHSHEWFDTLISTLTSVKDLTILPCLSYTPPPLAQKDANGKQRTSHPPSDLMAFDHFVTEILHRYGDHFSYVQLWNEPNWDPYWSWNLDPTGEKFSRMIIPAAQSVQRAGKHVALGGTTPLDYAWFARMEILGVLTHVDAIGFHFSPSWDNQHRRWQDIPTEIAGLRAMLRGFGRTPEVWLAETGFSTWAENPENMPALEHEQLAFYERTAAHPVDRFYWYSLFDQKRDTPTDDELNLGTERDMTAYHFGMVTSEGREKPLYVHLKERPSL